MLNILRLLVVCHFKNILIAIVPVWRWDTNKRNKIISEWTQCSSDCICYKLVHIMFFNANADVTQAKTKM